MKFCTGKYRHTVIHVLFWYQSDFSHFTLIFLETVRLRTLQVGFLQKGGMLTDFGVSARLTVGLPWATEALYASVKPLERGPEKVVHTCTRTAQRGMPAKLPAVLADPVAG